MLKNDNESHCHLYDFIKKHLDSLNELWSYDVIVPLCSLSIYYENHDLLFMDDSWMTG